MPSAGVQYLFTDARIETLDLGARADWAFSPSLTFQLFVEPKVTAVEFDGLRALARAGSYDFVPAEGEPDDQPPDFDFTRALAPGQRRPPVGVGGPARRSSPSGSGSATTTTTTTPSTST